MCFQWRDSQWKHSFIAPGSYKTHSAPGYRITKFINPAEFTFIDLDKYLEGRTAMEAHAITTGDPLPAVEDYYRVKVYIYCPPCACQVATALDICQYSSKKDLVDFCIRIDHRQKTSCSASVSRIEGLVSVVSHLKEKEKSTPMDEYMADKFKSIDREWLEQEVYHYTEEDPFAIPSPVDLLARIAELHQGETRCAAIILLGEADYCVPLMGVPPFSPLEPARLPQETQLFRYMQKYRSEAVRSWERCYMGTYTSKAPLPTKRPAPVDSITTPLSESAQRGSKRSKSSASDQEGS